MRNYINITDESHTFPYIIEYVKSAVTLSGTNEITDANIKYCNYNNTVYLLNSNVCYYKNLNNWYNIDRLPIANMSIDNCIPTTIKTSNIKIYIPNHSPVIYSKKIKYALSLNTWTHGIKVDLGTYVFKPTDTIAIPTGAIKKGNNEYHEYISFDIIDPFYIIYSNEWNNFRNHICSCNQTEPSRINNAGSNLYVSLYVIEESDDGYIAYNGYSGGYNNFLISNNTDFFDLKLSVVTAPRLGFKFDIKMNETYNSLLTYITKTYNLNNIASRNIVFDVVIKNKNEIIIDPNTVRLYNADEHYGNATQYIYISNLENNLIKSFLNDWNNFVDGYSIVGSLTIYDESYYNYNARTLEVNENKRECISFVSNEIPITQELFSLFANGGSEKIIDIEDMNITTYNVVNKIENKIIQVERPNESKSNIVQPVFFRSKDSEILTLHPLVTENISINLDDYKSKVDKFILQIGNSIFNQIGANSYGILFKITANTISPNVTSGTYYILNENKELVTTGKYNCVR